MSLPVAIGPVIVSWGGSRLAQIAGFVGRNSTLRRVSSLSFGYREKMCEWTNAKMYDRRRINRSHRSMKEGRSFLGNNSTRRVADSISDEGCMYRARVVEGGAETN